VGAVEELVAKDDRDDEPPRMRQQRHHSARGAIFARGHGLAHHARQREQRRLRAREERRRQKQRHHREQSLDEKGGHGGLYVTESDTSGMVNENVDPWPGAESIHTLPPCASTRRLTIDSPRPVPPYSRVDELST